MTELSPDIQGLLDKSYESDLTEEESEQLLSMCGHGIGPKLSPAAQAVWDAFNQDEPGVFVDYGDCLAAALRALAELAGSMKHWHVDQIRAIADELDGANG